MPCDRCGHTHERCAAHRRDGQPCTQWPVRGADKCKMHAGRKASDLIGQHEATRAAATYGLPVDIDPHDALLAEVHRTAGHVQWLGQVVEQLEQKALTHGITRTVQKADGNRDVTAEAAVNVWVKLYQDERDRLTRVARAAIECGVAERTVRVAEDQARQLANVVSAVLTDLGHNLEDEQVRRVVRLRLIEGGKAA